MQPLPIDPLLPRIVEAVRSRANVILTATPGAGKTTRLPPELLRAVQGEILVLEPRRMAAVSAAHRIADERRWRLGSEVGYQVRFESKTSRETRLNFVTDALALRRLSGDPELRGVDLVVIDEFHERNLNQDLMLGCVRELQELGREIKLVVMSATLDTDALTRFLPGSDVIDVPGKVFPLEVRHQNEPLSLATNNEFFDRVTRAVRELAAEGPGDVLVFLPGVGEIARVSDRLEQSGLAREIQALHGSLPLGEQQRVLRGGSGRPRVVLATNVAEASVTVDGVDKVVDCGLAKAMVTGRTGFSRLELGRISLFNARQRAGRAARQKEGIALRLWTPHEEVTQAVEPVPECRRADLGSALLLLAHLGVSDFMRFAWLDHPPAPLLQQAVKALRGIGALDRDSRLTELGRRLIRFPLPPRLGALLVRGEEIGAGDLAARAAAVLGERDLLDDSRSAPTTRLECDLSLRLEMLDDYEQGRARHLGRRAQQVSEAARQLASLVQPGSKEDAGTLRRLLLETQVDRLCRRRGKGERAVMMGGRGVRLSPNSQVRESEFFIALDGVDLPGQADTVISVACGVSKDLVLDVFADRVQVQEDIHFDEEKMKFFARRGRFLDDLPLEEPSFAPVDASAIADRLVDVLTSKWDWLASRHEGLKSWMERYRFVCARDARWENLLSEDARRRALEMAAFGKTSVQEVLESDLVGTLESVLDRALVRELHQLAPREYVAPSGFKHKIDYAEGHAAYVEVRLQEMFGLATSPTILAGRVPLTFRLLGPNFRPVQVTSDIPGFWKTAYPEVRKELRARYPKHSWPEDPLTAKPEAKGRRKVPGSLL